MVLSPLLLLLVVGGGFYLGGKFDEASKIAVVSNDSVAREAFIKQTEFEVDDSVDTRKKAEEKLKSEDIDGILTLEVAENSGNITASYQGLSSLGGTDNMKLSQLLSSIQLNLVSQKLGVSSENITKLLAPITLSEKKVVVENNQLVEKKDDKAIKTAISSVFTILLFVIITIYAQIMAQEVTSEKGTRIMEIILSSTSAANHFYGKIMGIFMVILTQIGLYVILIGISLPFLKKMDPVKDFLATFPMKDLLSNVLSYNLVYLLLGVMLYSVAGAFCGSLVTKIEDAGKAVMPVTTLSTAGYGLAFVLGMSSPDNVIMKVTSFIPFLSSFTMPVRIANGEAQLIEIILSLLLLVLTFIFLLKVSAMLYKSTALAYGDEGMIKELKKSIQSIKRENAIK